MILTQIVQYLDSLIENYITQIFAFKRLRISLSLEFISRLFIEKRNSGQFDHLIISI